MAAPSPVMVGGGIIGCASAHELVKAGCAVTVIGAAWEAKRRAWRPAC